MLLCIFPARPFGYFVLFPFVAILCFYFFFSCVILAAFCFASKNILFILCVCALWLLFVPLPLCPCLPATVPHWLFPSFIYFSFSFLFFLLINLRLFMFSICLQKLFVYFIRQPPPLLATFSIPLPHSLPLYLSCV